MQYASAIDKWDLAANESVTVFDSDSSRLYRIYNRGPGAVMVLDRQNLELGILVAGNCIDFIGDHFTIHARGMEPAKGLCEPIRPATRRSPWD